MAVRASYGLAYDFPAGETWFNLAAGPPYGNRLLFQDPPGRLDDPYAHVGGDPRPVRDEPGYAVPALRCVGRGRSGHQLAARAAVERHRRTAAGDELGRVGELSGQPLGSLLGDRGTQSRVYLGAGPCTINGVAYPVCTVPGNLNNRRVLYLRESAEGAVHRQRWIASTIADHAGLSRPEAVRSSGAPRAA